MEALCHLRSSERCENYKGIVVGQQEIVDWKMSTVFTRFRYNDSNRKKSLPIHDVISCGNIYISILHVT